MEAWYTTALDIEEVLSGAVDSDIHLFVADVIMSFDTVDRGILDRVLSSFYYSDVHLFVADVIKSFYTVDRGVLDRILSSLGLSGFFHFEYHARVRLRFKLASGLGEPWTRDGEILPRVPFEHDVYCRFVPALVSVSCCTSGYRPQLYADNF